MAAKSEDDPRVVGLGQGGRPAAEVLGLRPEGVWPDDAGGFADQLQQAAEQLDVMQLCHVHRSSHDAGETIEVRLHRADGTPVVVDVEVRPQQAHERQVWQVAMAATDGPTGASTSRRTAMLTHPDELQQAAGWLEGKLEHLDRILDLQ